MNDGASKQIITDLAKSIKDVFKKYSKSSRQKGWDIVRKGEGEKQISKFIVDPNYPLSGIQRLNFKEWLDT